MIFSFYQNNKNGCEVRLKVVPNAAKSEICGVIKGPHNKDMLKVKVAAVPDSGKANKALIKFLAKEWSITPSLIEIISGKTSAMKKILITDQHFLPEKIVQDPEIG